MIGRGFRRARGRRHALQVVRGLTFVEPVLAPPAKCRVRVPFDHEERPLNTTQFRRALANWPSFRDAEKLLQDRRQRDGSRGDQRREMKNSGRE